MGASVHTTPSEGIEAADATAIQLDYLAWVSERTRCCSLEFVQDPAAPRRWAANEEMAIELLRRVAAHHGW